MTAPPPGSEGNHHGREQVTPEQLHDVAVTYAQCFGWRGFPVRPGEKVPALSDWPRAASNDPAVVSAWWSDQYRGFNIGIATGEASNLLVLDIDNKLGALGDERFVELCAELGPMPDTPMVLTPHNGRHVYLAWPGFNPPQDALGPGIDVQGEGRFVVAPPSWLAS
jgi:Bifunctional DNA primase/polymerase, N-terminal